MAKQLEERSAVLVPTQIFSRQLFLLSSLSEANLSSTHYTIPQEFAGFFSQCFWLKMPNFTAAPLKYCNTWSSVFRHSCDEIAGATENCEMVAFFRIITDTH